MVFICALMFQDQSAILRKYERAVYAIHTEDHDGVGFSIAGGKYLMTFDHVIGSDAKIAILEPKAAPRHGYLVFHDAKLDIAVYRMDRVSPVSLSISGDEQKIGKPIYVLSAQSGTGDRSIVFGTILGINRDGERADIQFDFKLDRKLSGSPLLNDNGQVVGMAQASTMDAATFSTGISGFSLNKYLRDQAAPPDVQTIVGNLGQVLDTTRVCETPDLDSRSLFFAAPLQYLIVNDYSADFLKVTLTNGAVGYIRSSMVKIVVPNVTTGTPGVVNGYEVARVVKTFDATGLKATSTNADWQKETARFVGAIFATSGREISDDASIQIDIGRPVNSVDDLQIGDRLYFGSNKSLFAAIYLGNDEYISVNKAGKLVTTKFGSTSSKPFYRALH